METVTTIAELRSRRRAQRREGLRLALVPTMGYLHEGHLSLVRRAAQLADRVWVSIYVNPTQFGPDEDLDRYPRDLDRDRTLLAAEGVDLVFAPSDTEMYSRPPLVAIGFSGLESRLCGQHRPGHFAGVGLVVAKLLNIVAPEVAVFGQKDAQQALLIQRLVADLDFPIAVEVAPTVREADGLAMSSRNAYLSAAERAAAPTIHRALEAGRSAIQRGERNPQRVCELMAAPFADSLLKLEYAECVAQEDLCTPATIHKPVLLAIAAHAGSTRLIDNCSVDADDLTRN